ncbi:transposase [Streptomyces sp. NPDC005263]|uniref:transposase n=1 Tax=Streptomyces sp. NPDC005263 TaxID=3364711 RepID=UPI0036C67BEF
MPATGPWASSSAQHTPHAAPVSSTTTRTGITGGPGPAPWPTRASGIDETRSWGLEVPLAVADAGYGDAAAFRHGLQERGLNYVVGISTTLSAQPADAA